MKKPSACHFVIKKAAKDIAGDFYHRAAHDNDFHKYYPNEKKFINREYWRFIPAAREALWKILRGEADASMRGNGLTEEQITKTKDDVLDVLMKDKSLPQGGKMVSQSQFIGHA